MPDETETTTSTADPKVTAPLAVMFNQMLEQREQAILRGVAEQLAVLASTPAGDDNVRRIAGASDGDGDDLRNDRIISRRQPTDPLYRSLYSRSPNYEYCRTADLDHWNIDWLRGFLTRDTARMNMARVKANAAAGYRANEDFEGDLSGTDLTDGTGGHLLPQPFADVVDTGRLATAVVAPLCTNLTTTGATMRVPTAGAVTADTAIEGAAPTQANPTYTSEMMILHKIGCLMIASDEMLDDAAFNLMELYGRKAGEAIGVAEDTQILTTAGVVPDLTEALAGGVVTLLASPAVTYEDLTALFFSLGKAYQPFLTWLGGTLVMTLLSNLMDGNDHPILKLPAAMPTPVTDATPNAIGTVLGRPIYHVPATAGDLILGDLRSYAILRKGGIVAKFSNEVGWATDTVQFKFTERIDGRIIDDVGMKELQGITAVA